ncbi:MAG TPA: ATP-grasp domain-containing protein [Candidatus Acidoferrum sp.]
MSTTATVAQATVPVPVSVPKYNTNVGALVMAADYRGLGVVRSLGRRGIPVWVLKQGGHLVASTSRYVRRNVPWPAADDGKEIDLLLDLAKKHGLKDWLLFPTDDHAVGLISRHHDVLASQYRISVLPWDQLQYLCDKRLLHQTAHELGIPQPRTAWPRTKEELRELDCPFPAILKPATRLRRNNLAVPKAWRVMDRASLLALYDEASALVGPGNLMVQEIIPGVGEGQISYATVCSDGYPLASIVAREKRQYPRDFGQFSTFVESVEEPKVIHSAVRLLTSLRFTGLVEIEFKQDPRDGEFKLLDVNPRVWGWHTLCRRAGVDFPHLLWLLMHGQTFPVVHGRSGVRWMHTTADVPVALQEILKGRLSLRSYLRSLQHPRESALFAWDDPAPGLLDLPLFACALGKRMLQRGS